MSSLSATTVALTNIKNFYSQDSAIILDSNGRTRFPYAPAFYGYRSITNWENYGLTLGENKVYIYNVAVTNRENCYDTSTGTFTCPVEGFYGVCPGALMGNNGASASLIVFKNGVAQTTYGVHGNTVGQSNWFHNATVFFIKCVPNDKLQIRCSTEAATIYGEGYAHCSIWLHC